MNQILENYLKDQSLKLAAKIVPLIQGEHLLMAFHNALRQICLPKAVWPPI